MDNEKVNKYFDYIEKIKIEDKVIGFPVVLNDAWNLIFSNKDDAIQFLLQEGRHGRDYMNTDKGFRVSVSFFEFMSIQENRDIFMVYSSKLHSVVKGGQDGN